MLNRVDKVLKNWGWHKIEDKTSTAFTLKWSELKQSIDYQMFREGRDNCNDGAITLLVPCLTV